VSDVEDLYELSPMQQGMLFHALGEPDSPGLYVLQVDSAFRGPLEHAELAQAWQMAVDRHPALRTSIHWAGVEKPLQVVHRQVQLQMREEDWTTLSAEERVARHAALVADERRPFDLEQAPLMRVALACISETEHRVVWSFHHIAMEGWSAVLVLRDVEALYGTLRRDKAIPLEERRPYRDYILWLQQQDPAQVEAYWRKTLGGVAAPTPLVVDRPDWRPTGRQVDYGEAKLALSESASDMLRALAKRHRLTISTLVQGAWALLLSRYSGQRDVVFGSVVSGRPPSLQGSHEMVGLFINTLAARAHVDEDAVASAWLEQLQREQAEMREYEHSPLVNVQGWSEVPRGRPLFESIVILHNWGTDASRFLPFAFQLEIGDNRWFDGGTGYPLVVSAVPDARLALQATFDRGRFEAPAIERMLGHWRTLLEGLASNPQAPIRQLPMLSAPELAQLSEWNATEAPRARVAALPDLIEAQVARTPDAVAAEFEGARLTYRELNARANALALELRTLGVGPGVLVGICMERSLEMLVCVLAVMKAGGAYVPLDPSYPSDRLAYMLEDCGAGVLLTQASLLASLPPHRARVLLVEAGHGAGASAADAPGAASPEDLAYVIYTSGSTGRPKGVQVAHRSLVNFLESMRREPGLGPEDVLLSVTTLSFDIAGLELYLPLVVGGRLVLASRDEATDGDRLLARLGSCGATAMQATPATWRLLLEAGWSGDARLKILCGGEALPADLAERLLERGSSVWNLFGPTETTIWSTLARLTRSHEPVTVGRPIANTRIYLVDGRGRQVPVGVPGELCIGGEGLARGYLKRPDLTAERFVPDPFAGEPGARIYKTGDLARRLPDGEIEWLSRIDQQVKIRGFRIELGEIEAALLRHPDVARAAATAKLEAGGDQRLVAYLVPVAGVEPTATELRSHLKSLLPVYMVPSSYVFLDALPLTPNGKLDRKALVTLDARQAPAQDGHQAPRTPTESLLAELWQQVLGIERVSVRDNFFDLGGHSLLAMKVLSAIEKRTGLRVNPRDIVFQTLEQFAAACDERLRAGAEAVPRGLAGRLFEAVKVTLDSGRRA
jgi:amino acid adenylation domain-containing protein